MTPVEKGVESPLAVGTVLVPGDGVEHELPPCPDGHVMDVVLA